MFRKFSMCCLAIQSQKQYITNPEGRPSQPAHVNVLHVTVGYSENSKTNLLDDIILDNP
jgi:hypothetical protein